MATTSSSIEKVKVVPSFVWLSMLNILLVALNGDCKSILTLSMAP